MNSQSIVIQSPTRVDLAGGTLDMWPLYCFVGHATTINLAINIWTKVELIKRDDQKIKIHSLDLKKIWEFETYQQLLDHTDPQISLFQKILEKFKKYLQKNQMGFELTTSSESPIGGGLGGSSSLVISILKAFNQFFKIPETSAHEMVHLAHNIEAEVLRTPTGTQDYYPAVTGGLSFIEYGAEKIEQTVIDIKGTPLESHFLLVYTGKSHHSGLNNFEVLKSCVEGDKKVLAALNKINAISAQMKTEILNKNWNSLPGLFQKEFEARIELTPAFSSPEIEKLAKICVSAGALAVKICGAGGGGCVLVWVPPDKREGVVQVCQNEKFQCLNAHPVNPLS